MSANTCRDLPFEKGAASFEAQVCCGAVICLQYKPLKVVLDWLGWKLGLPWQVTVGIDVEGVGLRV